MNQNLTDIHVIVDRSGSMGTIKSDMDGAFNTFRDDQAKQPGECRLSLYTFDDRYDVVYTDRPVAEAPDLDLQPRNMTALLDAIGKTINDVGARYSAMDESARPGKVLVVVITDGHENASREFSAAQVKDMITHQQDVYGWTFTFLGANIDAATTATAYGIPVGNALQYAATGASVRASTQALSSTTTLYRAGKGFAYQSNDVSGAK